MRALRFFGIGIFFLTPFIITAQSIDPAINVNAPRIFPTTPNVSALVKYTGVNVNLNTGMASYQVPIWDFNCNDIAIPISASYNSGGIKVNEYPSFLGMSWVINAGGVISRQLNGASDETASRKTFTDTGTLFTNQNYQFTTTYFNPAWKSGFDTEPDLYSFNFGGYSGKFVMDSLKRPVLLEHSAIKIIPGVFGTSEFNFCIITPKGDKYFFGGVSGTEYTYSNNTSYANQLPHPSFIPTAYYLVKIISAMGEEILFSYDDYDFSLDPVGITQINNYIDPGAASQMNSGNWSCSSPICPPTQNLTRAYADYKSKRLKTIYSRRYGSVSFSYQQYNLYQASAPKDGAYSVIDKIYIRNNRNSLVRTVQMTYDFVVSNLLAHQFNAPVNSNRPFLKLITIGEEKYQFKYYEPEDLPVYSSFAQDHWGYFNGRNNSSFISGGGDFTQTSFPDATANREPDHAFSQKGLLCKITSPTGGYDSLVYEGHFISGRIVGGSRVKKIFTKDEGAAILSEKRIYYYSISDLNDSLSNGNSTIPLLNKQMVQGAVCNSRPGTLNEHIPVLLECIYTQRSSSPFNDLNLYSGYHLSYGYVTESYGGDQFENGGVEHWYHTQANTYSIPVINGSYTDGGINYVSALNGKEYFTKTFTYKNGTINTVAEKWARFKTDYTKVDLTVPSYKVNVRYVFMQSQPARPEDFKGIDVIKSTYESRWVYIDSISEKTYSTINDQQYTQQITKYEYSDPSHGMITALKQYQSSGDVIKNSFAYPIDKARLSVPLYQEMVQKNIVTPVVEQIRSVNDVIQDAKRVDYHKNSFDLILPFFIREGRDTSSLITRITFNTYDSFGLVKEYKTNTEADRKILYGYGSTLPVADIINADGKSVAYASFESTDAGGWILDTTAIIKAMESITGSSVYDLSRGGLTHTITHPSSAYVLTYWLKNDANASVAQGGQPIVSRNGWTFYRKELTGVTNLVITGTGIIDELRLYPKDAQMTTYTYEPLVGMTSQCDPNNRITYYEYDAIGRLKIIRDQDRNIIKTFQYNYQQ